MARWLAGRTGPTGNVLASDIDTVQLIEAPGIEVLRHDINDGPPPGGPFDLIHVRLVLMHLSRRAEILERLIDALAPGGWLVIGDFCGPQQRVLSAPSTADEVLFYRVQYVAHHVVARGVGVSYDWADEIDRHMTHAGLAKVATLALELTVTGGDTGCLLSRNYLHQLEPLLLDAGLSPGELRRYDELLLDPRFRAWFNRFVCTRGQKPLS